MLEGPDTTTIDSSAAPDRVQETAPDTVQGLHELLVRLQGELKFRQTRIDALNFEIARLKRWRFGSSSESLDTSTQAVLFDHILVDTVIEDRAAEQANKPPGTPPRVKGQAVRQAPGAARQPATHRASPRTPADPLRLWAGPQAHRRRGQ